MVMPELFNLAKNLDGYKVGKWKIVGKLPYKATTGGFFSVGYNVVDDLGNTGFLKALDFSSAFLSPSPIDSLKSMTEAYTYERDLLNKCLGKNLRYVVRIVDYGVFHLEPIDYPPDKIVPYPDVYYIVLEKADKSARNLIDLSKTFDYAWALRSLHNVSVAIEEMHGIQIAHQDIKPSNVLLFDSQKTSKVTDFGRSSTLERAAEHDALDCAGDVNYSPFEHLYGDVDSDWKVRRYSCDMFMFGNLIMTYFNNISMTSAVLSVLPDNMRPGKWGDTYRAILPQIELIFAKCLESFNDQIDWKLRSELVEFVKQLCHPDISKRGDLKNSHMGSQQYSLRRYTSKLDLLARKWEYSYKKVIL